ncbi:MAG: twin-arginine translocation signal domain-containing protein [Methanocellales archaeon]|nr:twin-arginine translocation signal domain-containing protein [Methanocellales archaeon]
MKMGRRRFLKYLAFAGAMATMGFSGCLSSPEPAPTPMPTPMPTPRPTTVELTPISRSNNKNFTETKKCPQCWMPTLLHIMDIQGVLWWVCDGCSYMEKVMEPEILRKYGYST